MFDQPQPEHSLLPDLESLVTSFHSAALASVSIQEITSVSALRSVLAG